jgi:flagellar protein FlbB
VSDYRRVGSFPRIFVLILLVLVLLFGGLLWFDYLGIIDVKSTLQPVLSPVLSLVGIKQQTAPPPSDSPLLLDSARLQKAQESLLIREQDLQKQEQLLKEESTKLDTKAAEIKDRETKLADQEKSFNEKLKQYDNRRANLITNSEYLTNMPPDQAVAIMAKYDDQLLIDTLRVTDELAKQSGKASLVPYWLSKLPPARVAEIQNKMAIKPSQ